MPTRALHSIFRLVDLKPGMLLPENTAKYLAEFTNAGSPCTTYWQYTDTQYTQSFGWYKYPPEVGRFLGKEVGWDSGIYT